MEKEYRFSEYRKGLASEHIFVVKESELTPAQKDLLLGEIVKDYGDLPAEVQDRFKDWFKKKYNY